MQSKEMKKVLAIFKKVNKNNPIDKEKGKDEVILDNNKLISINPFDKIHLSYSMPENTGYEKTLLPLNKLTKVVSTIDSFHFAFDTQEKMHIGNVALKTVGTAETIDPLSTNNSTCTHIYNSANFFNALKYASLSISKDETRKHINGFLVDNDKMVATDGHRIHMCTLTGESEKSYHVSNSVSDLLLSILKINKKAYDIFKVSFIDDDYLTFTIGRFTLQCKNQINDVNFPPYDRVIPTDNDICIPVNVKDFTKNVKQARAILDDERVCIRVKNNKLTLSSLDNDCEVDCFTIPFEGELSMCFNSKYLLESLQVNCDSVSLNFNGELDPVLIKSDNALSALMPMRM